LYPFFLIEAYRYGDLSTSFPLIRGSVPLLVTAFAAIALGQLPGTVTLVGIALVSAAVASFAWSRGSRSHKAHGRGIAFALLTGLVSAAYTVIDAIGLRVAPTALVYIVWLFVLDGICVALLVIIARRGAVITFIALHWKISMVAGVLGTLTYGLALLAFSLGPMAEISALRETSILFAALIGALILKEPFGKGRAVAALVAVTGIVIIYADR
jgi:drug/metabolite transporter (DMT)-like permease